MSTKELGSMIIFVLGFLMVWGAMRMGWVLARPTVAKASPQVAQTGDFILL